MGSQEKCADGAATLSAQSAAETAVNQEYTEYPAQVENVKLGQSVSFSQSGVTPVSKSVPTQHGKQGLPMENGVLSFPEKIVPTKKKVPSCVPTSGQLSQTVPSNVPTPRSVSTPSVESDPTTCDLPEKMMKLRGRQKEILYYFCLKREFLRENWVTYFEMRREMYELGIRGMSNYLEEQGLIQRKALTRAVQKLPWVERFPHPENRNMGQKILVQECYADAYIRWFEEHHKTVPTQHSKTIPASGHFCRSVPTSYYKERKKESFFPDESSNNPENKWHHPILDYSEEDYKDNWPSLWKLGFFKSKLAQALKKHHGEMGGEIHIQKIFQSMRNAEWELSKFGHLCAAQGKPADNSLAYLVRTMVNEGFWRRHKDHLHSDKLFAQQVAEEDALKRHHEKQAMAEQEEENRRKVHAEREKKIAEAQDWCDRHTVEEQWDLIQKFNIIGAKLSDPTTYPRSIAINWTIIKERMGQDD